MTSFLTGVTEPIEFTFMFLAPVLYVLHAIATGLAMVVMNAFGVRLGFSFSAGLFDYLLNFSHAQRPLLLLPIGAGYFGLYYLVFRVCIVRSNLATPGREADDATGVARRGPAERRTRREPWSTALGGPQNLAEVEACTTRLRLVLVDNRAIDEPALKAARRARRAARGRTRLAGGARPGGRPSRRQNSRYCAAPRRPCRSAAAETAAQATASARRPRCR